MSHQDDYLSVEELIEIQKEETRDIIQALLEDGSDPDALYEIEHHLFAEDFDKLEKAAVEAFKMGFEVLEAEETEDEDGNKLLCFDATMQSALDAKLIDEQVENWSIWLKSLTSFMTVGVRITKAKTLCTLTKMRMKTTSINPRV